MPNKQLPELQKAHREPVEPEMSEQDPRQAFGQSGAISYDSKRAKMSPMKDALHLCMQMMFTDLPANTRMLCVGAGTGAEVLFLAQAFPDFTFTIVEPAAAMIEKCQQKVDQAGLSSRCTFHAGYVNTLPASPPFDAATAILVSHFMLDEDARSGFFREICERLVAGGHLVSADIATNLTGGDPTVLLNAWTQMLRFSDMPETEVLRFVEALGKKVAALPESEVRALIVAGGFDDPTLFFQNLLMHGFYARKTIHS